MPLHTRKPTGAVPWPVVLLEGGEKSGKTTMLVKLSASPMVGKTAILFLGEAISDEYGAYPDVRYEIIEHDGSWPSIIYEVREARDEARRAHEAGEPPFVLGIDTATAEWELHKDWGAAKARKSKSNQKKLRDDPDAEIKITTNIWNDVAARHAELMNVLLTFPGIVVITARGKETALMGPDGQPVEGKRDYRVEAHKNLCFDVSAWIRMFRDKPAVVVGARSVHAGIRPGYDDPAELDADWTLENLIFTTWRCNPNGTGGAVQQYVPLTPGRMPADLRDEATDPYTDAGRILELYQEARALGFGHETVINEHGDEERLPELLTRIGRERKAQANGSAAREPELAGAR